MTNGRFNGPMDPLGHPNNVMFIPTNLKMGGPLKGRRKWINLTWIFYGFSFQSFNFGIVQSCLAISEKCTRNDPLKHTYCIFCMHIILVYTDYSYIYIYIFIHIHTWQNIFSTNCVIRGFPQILKSQVSTAWRPQVPSSMAKNPLLHRTWDCNVASIAGSMFSRLDRSFTHIVYVLPGRRW